jgi:hypothetical protein
MAGTLPAWIQAFTALAVAVGAGVGAYHRWMVLPVKEQADSAMSKAKSAHETAGDAADEIDALDDDLRDSMDDLTGTLDELVDSLENQRREARGRSYQLYVLSKAINESEETPDVPVPDEEDFLRGGGAFRGEGDD